MGIIKCKKCGEVYGDIELSVVKLLEALSKRAGFDGWWDDIDEDIKIEIVEELIGVVAGLQVIPEAEETEVLYGRIARKMAVNCIHGVSLGETCCAGCHQHEGPIEDVSATRCYGRIFRKDPRDCIHGVLLGDHCPRCPGGAS